MTETNLLTKQKQAHRPRGQTCGCQGQGEIGEGWVGHLCKLFYIEWINSPTV